MKKIPAFALLCLLALPAHAHDCDPPASACVGTAARTVSTPAGDSTVRWLQYTTPTTPPGMVNWHAYRPVDLIECRWTAAKIAEAAGRVALALTYAAFKAEIKAAEDACVVQPGTQREYEFLRLRWLGCRELANNPPPGAPADWLKPASAPAGWVPTDWCGAAPVSPAPPPPPPGVYVVTSTAAYPLNADGTRSITRWPQPAVLGEPCDAAVSVLSFGVRFYRIPRLSTSQTVVAGCAVKK